MVKINTFIVGAMKAGTTYLADILEQHQEVCVSRPKESMYFIDHPELSTRAFGEGYIDRVFQHYAGEKIICEASTQNLSSPESVEYIKKHNSDAVICCILRDPVDRAISHYKHLRRAGLVSERLEDFFRHESNQRDECIRASSYSFHLRQYKNAFGEGAVRIYFYEALVSDREAFVKKFLNDLGVDCSAQKLNLDFRSNESVDVRFQRLQAALFRNRRLLRQAKRVIPRFLYSSAKKIWHDFESLNTSKDSLRVSSSARAEIKRLLADEIEAYQALISESRS